MAVPYVASHEIPYLGLKVASMNQFERLSTSGISCTRGIIVRFVYAYSQRFVVRHVKSSLVLKLSLFYFAFR